MAIIPSPGAARAAGVAFAMSFTLAVTVGLGDLLGAFADAGNSFPAYFDHRPERLRHAAGAYLLAGSGLVFAIFIAQSLALDRGAGPAGRGVSALVASGTFAALLGLAAAALSTVSRASGSERSRVIQASRSRSTSFPSLATWC